MHARGGSSEPEHMPFLFTVLNLPTMMCEWHMGILKKCQQTRGVVNPRVSNYIKESKDCKLVMHTHKNETKFQLKVPYSK